MFIDKKPNQTVWMAAAYLNAMVPLRAAEQIETLA
jgi:hypothetical protein